MSRDDPRAGYGLTSRMRELLAYLSTRELCPTYDEMRRALGFANKGRVWHLITALEERGYIRRLPYKTCAIEVLKPAPPRTVEINGQRFLFISEKDRRLSCGESV